MENPVNVEGKTYLVTGGASGLGEACVRLLFAKNANVVIMDRNTEGQKLVSSLNDNSRVLFVETDVTSEESVLHAIAKSKEKFGKIHGAINCAGVGAAQRTASPRGPHNLAIFQKVIEINLTGTFNVCRLVAHAMLSQEPDSEGERGVLINTASVAAYEGQIGQVAYAASKGGVASMTLVMARDLARHGIRVMTIAPGPFSTSMLEASSDETKTNLAKQATFPPRFGRPPEFAHLALSIIQNRMLNGEVIRIDAGTRMAAL